MNNFDNYIPIGDKGSRRFLNSENLIICYIYTMESMEKLAQITTSEQAPSPYTLQIEEFLGETKELFSPEEIEILAQEVAVFETKLITERGDFERAIFYNKHTKTFSEGTNVLTKGQIVSSRHFQGRLSLPKSQDTSFEEKKLTKTYHEGLVADFVFSKTNKILAEKLAEIFQMKNTDKAEAYEAIARREEVGSEQLGVVAEKLMIGLAECIAIDRPDLKIKVLPANAYEDVENKIDFIIETTQKKRGAGIETKDLEPEHKSVGIQFTINTNKKSFKEGQISKAKERGVHVDDIVYVDIDMNILLEAMKKWEKSGKPISGPWNYLPKETKIGAIKGLFHSVLTTEQEESLIKGI